MEAGVIQILLNWLWQGIAIVLVVGLAIRLRGPALNAATRERIWWITLLAVVGIPAMHVCFGHLSMSIAPAAASAGAGPSRLVVSPPEVGLVVVAGVWILWTSVSLFRLAAAAIEVRRIRREASPLGPREEARWRTWCALRGRGRSARLVVSPAVHRAAVLGLGRPLIALAPETMSRLTDDALDQVLVHEYAHVQRRDDLAILLQRALVAIAGLHPAVWWVDRALTIEREVACDDWVVAHTGGARRYASCLVGLVTRAGPAWHVSPGAALSRPQVAVRVARLLDRRRNQTTVRSRTVLLTATPLLAGLLAASAALPLIEVTRERVEPALLLPLAAGPQPGTDGRPGPTDQPPATRDDRSTGVVLASRERPGVATIEARSLEGPRLSVPPVRQVVRAQLAVSWEEPPTLETVAPVLEDSSLPALSSPAADSVLEGTTQSWSLMWGPVAAAGTAIGAESSDAAVNTARFFTRLGTSIAGAF